MWAVYNCGPTDCSLQALFSDEGDARNWAILNCKNPEGCMIEFVKTPEDIDRTDTGWPG